MEWTPELTHRLLERWLPEYGYHADSAALQRFARYLGLVAAWNQRVRLVGSADAETLVRRHLGESLYLGTLLPLERQTVTDVGAGAGFPGLALALGWPGLNTTLVESTGKKAAFLSAAVAALELDPRVQVWGHYLEHRPTAATPLRGAAVVTVRALEKMEAVPGWIGRGLEPEATVAFWVGAAMAARWRACYPEWRWSRLHPLPGSRERGIVVGQRST